MAWRFDPRIPTPVAKQNGKCFKKCQWKYCPYWVSKTSMDSGNVFGYFCTLFNHDLETDASLEECNTKYGQTYEGPTR